jgi:hypothetical protein
LSNEVREISLDIPTCLRERLSRKRG